MKTRELIKCIEEKKTFNLINTDIKGIAYDSRKVKENFLFAAIRGNKSDGHLFIKDAIDRGAKIIVAEKRSTVLPSDISEIIVQDSRDALHKLAAEFYGHPSKKINVVGITGTKGKTTVSYIIKHVLEHTGNKCGILGTISYQIGERTINSTNTTPESLDIQQFLADMLEEKCKWAVMEVSSHGSIQGRTEGIHFDTGIFTNIASHEHLDYHKTFRNYLHAKLIFFDTYMKCSEKENKAGIVNADDPYAKYFTRSLRKNGIRCVTCGTRNSDVQLKEYSIKRDGNYMKVEIGNEKIDFYTRIRGFSNIYNTLSAIAFAKAREIPMESVKEALASLESIPGRFESVNAGQDFDVIVDYAHTHPALANLLSSIRKMNPARIILVFGCGGDRDKTKRPLMGKVAVKMADIVFITSDNPRSENPEKIIEDIEKGIPFYRRRYVSMPDRKQAITEAVKAARKGDCVVIAGKGHESFQIMANTIIPFDDREEVKKAILANSRNG
ncbi:MAG TPA: UDP-N-acetylmuramoyl-L-alanyl-D-glutamate--2,6-diaminopimelate ligase [bacterium]|nr:UDP-N-acetylmuramoyl-L-alanyl-D-glutamate--2,6-diaminopimelate ligase [bacterium]